jgi:hypothetical protein
VTREAVQWEVPPHNADPAIIRSLNCVASQLSFGPGLFRNSPVDQDLFSVCANYSHRLFDELLQRDGPRFLAAIQKIGLYPRRKRFLKLLKSTSQMVIYQEKDTTTFGELQFGWLEESSRNLVPVILPGQFRQ